jgi:hypothetical protein
MNPLMLLVVALVIFVYFGGKNVPSVLRQNKEMLLGVVIGLVLCSFMGMRLEGFTLTDANDAIQFQGTCCNLYDGTFKTNSGYPGCETTTPNDQGLKDALCSQAMRTRKFTRPGSGTLAGPAANLQFKQTCCPTPANPTPDNINNSCFEYAFGKKIDEMTISEFFNDQNEWNNVCSP